MEEDTTSPTCISGRESRHHSPHRQTDKSRLRKSNKVRPMLPHTRHGGDWNHDAYALVHQTFSQYANSMLPNNESSSGNHVESLLEQFTRQDGALDSKTSTAIAIELVSTMMQTMLPESPIADAVVDTLLKSVYCNFDTNKPLKDNTRFADSHQQTPTPHSTCSTQTANLSSPELCLEELAQQWNQMILQRNQSAANKIEPEAPRNSFAACLDSMPLEFQCELAVTLAEKFESLPLDLASSQIEQADVEEAPDPGECILSDDDDEMELDVGEMTTELEHVYRLMAFESKRARQQARMRLRTLLLDRLGSTSAYINDERDRVDPQLRRHIQHLSDENPEVLAELGLY